ncbi:hypothetical protein PoB_000430200 [Plakobranchus ocellatus]|uniref:Uncharacterized protein n=1 Tax=Plakobranchus ocellatus TaxID=259542 RepID=A0AAV3Y6R6_9GAST|nr:hypothetical protein PoB_000430200 [Plakobranchus ocellatus]
MLIHKTDSKRDLSDFRKQLSGANVDNGQTEKTHYTDFLHGMRSDTWLHYESAPLSELYKISALKHKSDALCVKSNRNQMPSV